MISQQPEALLKQLGLTEYESRACLTLIRFGKCNAEKISSISNIPLPRVYDTMNSLADRGIISISKTRPQTFEIINLKKFFDILKFDEKRKIEEKIKNIDVISSQFFKTVSLLPSTRFDIEKDDIISFTKRKVTTEEIWNDIQNEAKKEFLVFAGDLSWIDLRANYINKLVKKGIKYKIIWFKPIKEVVPNVKKALKTGAELRYYDDYSNELRGIIADGKKVYLIQKKPKPGIDVSNLEEGVHWSEEIADYTGMMVNSALMSKIFRDYFYLLWEKSIPAEKFLKKF
jgi:sugar-specific transcriptional regulator TrmB